MSFFKNNGYGTTIVVPLEGSENPKTISEALHQRIELLGGRRAGTFKFEAKMYVTKPPQSSKKPIAPPTVEEGKMVFVVTSMLLPSSTARPILNPTCVAIGDIVLACEQPEFGLIDKLRNMYHFRKCAKVEGPYFELGDFILKTGSLFVNNGVKCALLEVQYPPCPMLPLCQELFKELVRSWIIMLPHPLPLYPCICIHSFSISSCLAAQYCA
eukprot:Sdes_comp20729_c0_seq3m16533